MKKALLSQLQALVGDLTTALRTILVTAVTAGLISFGVAFFSGKEWALVVAVGLISLAGGAALGVCAGRNEMRQAVEKAKQGRGEAQKQYREIYQSYVTPPYKSSFMPMEDKRFIVEVPGKRGARLGWSTTVLTHPQSAEQARVNAHASGACCMEEGHPAPLGLVNMETSEAGAEYVCPDPDCGASYAFPRGYQLAHQAATQRVQQRAAMDWVQAQ